MPWASTVKQLKTVLRLLRSKWHCWMDCMVCGSMKRQDPSNNGAQSLSNSSFVRITLFHVHSRTNRRLAEEFGCSYLYRERIKRMITNSKMKSGNFAGGSSIIKFTNLTLTSTTCILVHLITGAVLPKEQILNEVVEGQGVTMRKINKYKLESNLKQHHYQNQTSSLLTLEILPDYGIFKIKKYRRHGGARL